MARRHGRRPIGRGARRSCRRAAIVSGTRAGRTDPDQITLYKSVGVAAQDAAAVALVPAAGGGCNVDM